jgi:hypothetical protein
VSGSTLTNSITAVRKAVDDSGDEQRPIRTMPDSHYVAQGNPLRRQGQRQHTVACGWRSLGFLSEDDTGPYSGRLLEIAEDSSPSDIQFAAENNDVQTAVDTKNDIIVAHEVTNVGTDRRQLSNMAKQARTETGVRCFTFKGAGRRC